MKIIKQYNWNRRDFYFDAQCEKCGQIDNSKYGYDDRNYYDNVIPDLKCSKCGESTNSLSLFVEKIETKYPSHITF